MIVVTGSARTGTSMMMQTLINLGYKSVAPRFSPEHKGLVEHNKNGYYEIELEAIKQLGKKDCGKAVKVFGHCLPYVEPEHISKMIVMLRNKQDAVESSIPVFKKLGYKECADRSYDKNYQTITFCMKANPTIILKFEEVVANPEREILRLVAFLEEDFSKVNCDKAINNIKYYNHGMDSSSSSGNHRNRDADSRWCKEEESKSTSTLT